IGAQANAAFLRLPGCTPSLRCLDSVVDGVANEVCQRIADRFDQRLVQLRLTSLRFQTHLLAVGESGVMDEAREPIPDIAEWLEPRLHDVFLQLGGDQIELATRVLK